MRMLAVIVGILAGLVLGGILGMLLGLGAVALPGLGPMVAAGTLATTFGTASVGAIGGALIGGLIALVLVYGVGGSRRSRRTR